MAGAARKAAEEAVRAAASATAGRALAEAGWRVKDDARRLAQGQGPIHREQIGFYMAAAGLAQAAATGERRGRP